MTLDEARTFIARLRVGEQFVSRHGDEEWGLVALADGAFERWSRTQTQAGEVLARDRMSESDLVAMLERRHRFEVMCARLVPASARS